MGDLSIFLKKMQKFFNMVSCLGVTCPFYFLKNTKTFQCGLILISDLLVCEKYERFLPWSHSHRWHTCSEKIQRFFNTISFSGVTYLFLKNMKLFHPGLILIDDLLIISKITYLAIESSLRCPNCMVESEISWW